MNCNHNLKEKEDYCNMCEVYQEPKTNSYHVFSDGVDEYFTNKKQALRLAGILYKKYGCARVHKEVSFDELEGIYTDFICIFSKGGFPF